MSHPLPMLARVSRTEPNSTAPTPDEDRLELPETWNEYTFDRRGRGTPRPVVVDARAPGRFRAFVAESSEGLEQFFSKVEYQPYAEMVRAGLAGEPDPLSAAAALAVLCRRGSDEKTAAMGIESWIAEHGIVFAAQSMMELMGWDAVEHYPSTGRGRAGRSRVEVHHLLHYRYEFLSQMATMRSLLAAIPEAEYAEAVAAVEARRDTEAKGFVAAMLMPEQDAWVKEACLFYSRHRLLRGEDDLLWPMISTREHLELSGVKTLKAATCDAARVARLVDALGTEAFPVLAATLDGWWKPNVKVRKLIFEALERLPSDEAVARLFADPSDSLAMKFAMRAAKRFPTRSLRAVAAQVPDADDILKRRLEGIVRSQPALREAVSRLDAGPRASIDDLLEDHSPPVAPAAAIPAVFTEPPWSKPRTPPTVPGLTPPAVSELHWSEEELEYRRSAGEPVIGTTEDWRLHREEIRRGRHAKYVELIALAPMEIAEPAFAAWDGTTSAASAWHLERILERFGEAAVPRVLAIVKARPSCRMALRPILHLDAARLAAESLSSRSTRRAGIAWLDRHASRAAALLIPDALGEASKPRIAATRALRHLAESDPRHVRGPAAAYGARVASAVEELLDPDPLDPQVAKIPRPGAWADPTILPAVMLKGGDQALPREAVTTLLTALALDDPFHPYAGTDMVVAECDPESLLEFSWALFGLWRSSGYPAKDAWAMHQLARFADDATVERLAELVRSLSEGGQSRRAAEGVELLCTIGSDPALRALQSFTKRAKSKHLRKAAAERLAATAGRLGLSFRQLSDRLVPEFGLGDESALVLDYGPRAFTVGFDERLRLCVVDQEGKRRSGPPKPGAEDDRTSAQAAYERFAALRLDLKATVAEQVKRLENDMVERPARTGAEFRRYLVEHPLMGHLSSRLVWQVQLAGRGRFFRVAEDRTYADCDDRELSVPDDALVRLAHPAEMGEEVDRWAQTLADYEIVQPFEQLARPVLAFTETELRTRRLARFEGAVVGARALLGLLGRGWRYGGVPGAVGDHGISFRFPGGAYVFIDPEPGVHPGDRFEQEDQKLNRVELILSEDGGEIDPVSASEVLGVLARLTKRVGA